MFLQDSVVVAILNRGDRDARKDDMGITKLFLCQILHKTDIAIEKIDI